VAIVKAAAIERVNTTGRRTGSTAGRLGPPTAARRVAALQRAAGNAAVARLLETRRRSLQRSCCSSCTGGASCESHEDENELLARGARALRDSVLARRARPSVGRTLARYAHANCKEDDLREHVWPADHIARQMVKKAVKAVSADPMDPSVKALFPKYFMTATPNLAKLLSVLDKVDAEFRANDYTYECREDCASTLNGETWSGFIGALTSAHIKICMNNFRSRTNECLARTIVHEFTHRYADTDDHSYCKTGCGYDQCRADLTPEKALNNADSFACFVYEMWPMKLLTAAAEPAPAELESAVA